MALGPRRRRIDFIVQLVLKAWKLLEQAVNRSSCVKASNSDSPIIVCQYRYTKVLLLLVSCLHGAFWGINSKRKWLCILNEWQQYKQRQDNPPGQPNESDQRSWERTWKGTCWAFDLTTLMYSEPIAVSIFSPGPSDALSKPCLHRRCQRSDRQLSSELLPDSGCLRPQQGPCGHWLAGYTDLGDELGWWSFNMEIYICRKRR